MKIKLTLLSIIFLLICFSSFSVPSLNTPISYTQPDGKEIKIYLIGDEYYNYKTSLDGYILTTDSDNYLCYGYLNENAEIINTGIRASEIKDRDSSTVETLSKIDLELQSEMIQNVAGEGNRKARQRMKVNIDDPSLAPASNNVMKAAPTGRKKVLVVLVEYQDVRFSVNDTQQAFHKMLNQEGYSENGGTGSARDYFMGCSYGKYEPDFDVYGPITLANNRSYYGYDNKKSCEMASEACDYLYKYENVDFSQYDNTNDGYIDNIFVFFAGHGEAEGGPAESVWPFAWYVRAGAGIVREYNGKILDRFACSNELRGNSGTNMVGIGTFCHEFSHVLGLADYYDTANNKYTVGSWDIMAGGNYNNSGRTPPYWCSFSRVQAGWLKPTLLNPADTIFKLNDLSTEQVYKIATNKSNEYFLLENRQQKDFDKYLPGYGMLIWHVDYDANAWWSNSPNNDPNHQRLDLEEADNIQSGSNCGADPFPGTSGAKWFTDDTKPGMLSWDGTRQERVVREISLNKGIISFLYESTFPDPLAPKLNKATNIGTKTVTINWEPVEGADAYEVDVYRKMTNIFYTHKAVKVENGTSFSSTRLRADTEYHYVVRSIQSYKTSENSVEFSFKTTPEGFEGIVPQISSVTDITTSSFTVNWETVEDADSYNITILKDTYGDNTSDICDFSDKLNLPPGWDTNAKSTSGTAFGDATPSIRVNSSDIYVSSPLKTDPIKEFGFWYKTSSNIKENILIISLFDGYYWTPVDTVEFKSSESGIDYVLNIEESKYFAAEIKSFIPKLGSIYIDDIKVVHTDFSKVPVNGYNSKNIGNVTSYTFDKCESNASYNVMITAQKEDTISYQSDLVSVKVSSDMTSIEQNFKSDNVYFDSSTKSIINNSGNHVEYYIYDLSGMLIDSGTIKETCKKLIIKDGIYIIRIADNVIKVVI